MVLTVISAGQSLTVGSRTTDQTTNSLSFLPYHRGDVGALEDFSDVLRHRRPITIHLDVKRLHIDLNFYAESEVILFDGLDNGREHRISRHEFCSGQRRNYVGGPILHFDADS